MCFSIMDKHVVATIVVWVSLCTCIINIVMYNIISLPQAYFTRVPYAYTHLLSYIGFVISILMFRFLDGVNPLSYIGFVYPFTFRPVHIVSDQYSYMCCLLL